MGIIYCAVNRLNGKRYIGKTRITLEKRKWDHLAQSKRGRPGHFYRAIRKYGIGNFSWTVLETPPDEKLDGAERYWIKYYSAGHADLGYNIREGGNGGSYLSEEARERIRKNNLSMRNPFYGRHHSPETRQRMSFAAKRLWADSEYKNRRIATRRPRHCSAETRQKISAARKGKSSWAKGRHLSDETKQKIRLAHIGKKHAPETIEKLRALSKGENNPMYGRRWNHTKETRARISASLKRMYQERN